MKIKNIYRSINNHLVPYFCEEGVDVVHVPIFSVNKAETWCRLSIFYCRSFILSNLFLEARVRSLADLERLLHLVYQLDVFLGSVIQNFCETRLPVCAAPEIGRNTPSEQEIDIVFIFLQGLTMNFGLLLLVLNPTFVSEPTR